VAAIVAEAKAECVVDAVDAVDTEKAVKPDTSHESKCTYCKIDSHITDACRKRKRAQEGGNSGGNNKCICYQCGLPGHVKVNCVAYKRVKEWWRVKKATARAALAMVWWEIHFSPPPLSLAGGSRWGVYGDTGIMEMD
jgi:hypothetical protein